jgi:hypothetical protein
VKVEKILGEPLPPSARLHRPLWANQGRAHSLSWKLAGWKTADVDFENDELTFLHRGAEPEEKEESPKLTIEQPKAGLAANFGVAVQTVEITIRG